MEPLGGLKEPLLQQTISSGVTYGNSTLRDGGWRNLQPYQPSLLLRTEPLGLIKEPLLVQQKISLESPMETVHS